MTQLSHLAGAAWVAFMLCAVAATGQPQPADQVLLSADGVPSFSQCQAEPPDVPRRVQATLDAADGYSEAARIRAISTRAVQVELEFRSVWQAGATHYDVVPQAVAELLEEAADGGLTSLAISLGRGVWRSQQWGAPPPGMRAVGGAIVQASFSNNSDAAAHFKALLHSTSGLLCASLAPSGDSATETRAQLRDVSILHAPVASLPPYLWPLANNSGAAWYATLPSEPLCTENLTPWLKWLPCGSHGGLGAWVHPQTLWATPFHTLAIHAHKQGHQWQLTLHLLAVVSLSEANPPHLTGVLGAKSAPIPCPLATTAELQVHALSFGLSSVNSIPADDGGWVSMPLQMMADVHLLPVQARTPGHPSMQPTSAFHVSRFLTGTSVTNRGVALELVNPNGVDVLVDVFDVYPQFVQPIWATHRVSTSGSNLTSVVNAKHVVASYQLVPSQIRAPPSYVHMRVRLPARETVTFHVKCKIPFFAVDEFPPDPNRGMEMPASAVWIATSNTLLFSELVQVDLALPDFSMPYTVITLSSSIMTLLFGALFNVLGRKRRNLV